MKNFIWVGGVIVILILVMFWGAKGTAIEPPFEPGVIHPLDNVKGNLESKVVVTEYSDFQCPACRTYYPVMREMMAEFGDKVAFVYRHFPLIQIHPNAEFAARAAEAAARQGKFWEMHDLLFEKQSEWSAVADIGPMFESYATLLGISAEQFKADWISSEVKDFVKAQRAHAVGLGLQSTPSFFINNKQIQNPNSVEVFRTAISDALKSQ